VETQHVGVALVGLAFVPQYLWERPDLSHLRGHLAILLAVLGVALGSCSTRCRQRAAAGLTVLAAVLGGLLVIQHGLANATVYPCGEGKRIGARLEGGSPPWAGLPFEPHETLIVLPWEPGWYALESPTPGTRILAVIGRQLKSAAVVEAACADLRRHTNRWVITDRDYVRNAVLPGELAIARTILGRYRRVATWSEWELWERVAREEAGGLR